MFDATTQIKQQISEIDIKIKDLESLALSSDAEFAELAKADIAKLMAEKSALDQALAATENATNQSKQQTTGNLSDKSTACLVEIRAGTGGDEAGLFAHELYDAYVRYAEIKKWKTDLISKNEGGIGNFKEVAFEISGSSFSNPNLDFKNESGVHRVQRVPFTESGGRIHTSTITVAVLPIIDSNNIIVEIKPEHLRIDTFRAGGAGGQHVNKTESAIRITHLPTALVVQCQDERSQHKNKDRAMSVLKSRLYDLMQRQQKGSIDEIRADQVGTGDRSEKIKTYNFPQDRLTDHRIKKSWFGLQRIMLGDFADIFKDTREALDSGVISEDSDNTDD